MNSLIGVNERKRTFYTKARKNHDNQLVGILIMVLIGLGIFTFKSIKTAILITAMITADETAILLFIGGSIGALLFITVIVYLLYVIDEINNN